MRGWVLLAAAVAAFYGYYGFPDEDRPDVYYIAASVLCITLALSLWPHVVRSSAGRLACALCIVESAQQGICGAARWGHQATGQDLCKEWLGPDVYTAAASLALAAAITWGFKWRRE